MYKGPEAAVDWGLESTPFRPKCDCAATVQCHFWVLKELLNKKRSSQKENNSPLRTDLHQTVQLETISI